MFGTAKCVLFIEVSSIQDVLNKEFHCICTQVWHTVYIHADMYYYVVQVHAFSTRTKFDHTFSVGAELSQQAMSSDVQQQSPQPGKGSSSFTEEPTLPVLFQLGVLEEVDIEYRKFGVLLLDDQTGALVDSIEHDYEEMPAQINLQILQLWLEGRGLPVTWGTLITTLRACRLNEFADQIQTGIGKTQSTHKQTHPTTPHSLIHTHTILNSLEIFKNVD